MRRNPLDAPRATRPRRRQREQDRDCDERQPERRRQRRERIEDEHSDECRREDLRRADSTAARERNQRKRDHDERALRRHGEARQRGVVGRREQACRRRQPRDRGSRAAQAVASQARRSATNTTTPSSATCIPDTATRWLVPVRRKSAQCCSVKRNRSPSASAVSNATPSASALAAPMRSASVARNLCQRVAIAPPAASRDDAGAHVARRAVAVDEQPLLVVEAAGIARAARRPQPRRHGQRIAGPHAGRRRRTT